MNNSVFGKTMEHVRNRMQMHLTTDDANAEKWFSKPTFKNCNHIFGIYMIEMYQDEVVSSTAAPACTGSAGLPPVWPRLASAGV